MNRQEAADRVVNTAFTYFRFGREEAMKARRNKTPMEEVVKIQLETADSTFDNMMTALAEEGKKNRLKTRILHTASLVRMAKGRR